MALSTQQRWMLIGGALLLTLAAMYGLQEPVEESAPEIAMQRHVRTSATNLPSQSIAASDDLLPDLAHKTVIDTDAGFKAKTGVSSADLFKSHAWYVPPPPKPVVQPVLIEKPKAPPVPYAYMGKMEDTPQGTLIFLSANDKVQLVKTGQVIDGVWKLDKEDANALYFTYVPLGLPQMQSKTAKPAARNFGNFNHDNQDPDAQNPDNQNQDVQNQGI